MKEKKKYDKLVLEIIEFKDEKIEIASVSMGSVNPGDENISVDDLF